MAKTITQLPDATVVNAADELIVQQGGVTKRATKTEVLNGIVNANVDNAAAIAGTKIAPNFGAQDVVTTGACGIGTTSPTAGAKLDVRGGRTFLSAASEQFGLGVRFVDTGGPVYFGAASNSATPDAVISAAGGAELMRLTNSGNVGIGTSSPATKVDIYDAAGGGNPALRIRDNSTDLRLFPSGGIAFVSNVANQPLAFGTNNTERMRIAASGSVAIGTAAPNAAALLDVSSTTQGFLPPRMTTTQRNAISTPPAGLMVYNTTTNKLNFYNGTAWEAVTSS